ncbi:glycosyltransferase family 9 protein [Spirosoma gilvum]
MDKLTQTLGYTPKTIAVFRAIKLGDLLCAIPAFRALRRAFPDAHLALISLPWADEFVRAYPAIFNEFIPFPGWPGLPEQTVDPGRTVEFLHRMQDRQWDVVLQVQGNGTLVNAMLALFGAKLVAGYYLPDVPSERWAGQTGLLQPYVSPAHEVLRHIDLMTFLGIDAQGPDLEFTPTESDYQKMQEVLTQLGVDPDRFVCIHAGGISGRRWPENQFARVADRLAEQGYAVVFTGTHSEIPIVAAVQEAMSFPSVSVAGQTSLGQLGALLTKTALLISNDTGVAHLAVACGTPSVIIFTSADPAEWGPLNRDRHRVVHENNPDGYKQAIEEAMDLLNRS